MRTEDVIKYSNRSNTIVYNSVDRENFVCMEINIPNSNGYKKGEIFKDYYMRVLYECDKKKFMDLLAKSTLKLFITGGATREMMTDLNYYQLKHLKPVDGQVRIESDYRVIPLAKSLDVCEFFFGIGKGK